MVTLRKSSQRGHAQHGWLDSYHTFSFADYYDPKFMGFRALRVINEDRIEAGAGFPTHPHHDMEILTYLVEGAIEHRDSTGNHAVIRPGEVQIMSAGTGIQHSEFNHYRDRVTHLLQIWILPDRVGLKPAYGQKNLDAHFQNSSMVLIASPQGTDDSVVIHQDCRVYAGRLKAESEVILPTTINRHFWLQLVSGTLLLQGEPMEAGDGAALTGETEVKIRATQSALTEFLLFDLN
jgi:redox-sensitive bicupin YhaK (pirin superfamily)